MNNEPVAWWDGNTKNAIGISKTKDCDDWIPLYTHPVKELTDEEIMKTCIKHGIYDCISDSYIKDDGTDSLDEDLIRFARAILRKAQEK